MTWSGTEIAEALGARATCPQALEWQADGVSLDTRSLGAGDLFVALRGPRFDGNRFVGEAKNNGAVAAVAECRPAGAPAGADAWPVFVVPDGLEGLEALARVACARSTARRIAITGSSGKTSTRRLLTLALGGGAKVHASVRSHNNRIGVALTLARLPRDAEFAVLELGSNNPGEIDSLAAFATPELGLLVQMGRAHLGHFESETALVEEKTSLFGRLEGERLAVFPADEAASAEVRARLQAFGLAAHTFGEVEHADARLLEWTPLYDDDDAPLPARARLRVVVLGEEAEFVLSSGARHQARNTLGALLAARLLGVPLARATGGLAQFAPEDGRGAFERLALADGGCAWVVDDSYNANPESMRAALGVLAAARRPRGGRRLAVLGAMRELGTHADALHAALATDLVSAGVEAVFLVGEETAPLARALRETCVRCPVPPVEDAATLLDALRAEITDGDVVLFKGSLSTGLGPLVRALQETAPPRGEGGNDVV